ncbi:tigger transposable element-derived protein 1 [Trichonephila clavipes]|nr:tigger transposable element-derived protein 1 [Trichonephila clavipes]
MEEKKHQRQSISLETKIAILDRLGKGEGSTAIGKHFNLGESTVRAIKKNEAAIRKSVISGTKLSTKFASYIRDILLERTERAIAIWIEEQVQRRIPGRVCATADEGAAKIFPEELAKIIEDRDYSADEVFNADETGLYWKKLPNRTSIAKDEKTASGHKASKDRVTLLLCINASGDRMLKPLLINKSLRPRALKAGLGPVKSRQDDLKNCKIREETNGMNFNNFFFERATALKRYYHGRRLFPAGVTSQHIQGNFLFPEFDLNKFSSLKSFLECFDKQCLEYEKDEQWKKAKFEWDDDEEFFHHQRNLPLFHLLTR